MYRYQQVICSAVPQRMGNWCINLSCWKIPIARGLRCRDKQQRGFPGSAKRASQVGWCTAESIFICLGKVWLQQHYLSWRAQRLKQWLSGRQWVTQCERSTGLKRGWQKLGADWKVTVSQAAYFGFSTCDPSTKEGHFFKISRQTNQFQMEKYIGDQNSTCIL